MKNNILSVGQEMALCADYQSLIPKTTLENKYGIGWRKLDKILKKYNIPTNSQTKYLTGRKKLSMYEYWVKRYGKEIADKKMIIYSKKRSEIHSGKNNPMYNKPSPNGSGQGWKGWYKNFYFRSLRELSYVLFLDKNNIKWQSAEKKEFRIPYKDWNGIDRTYAPDFLIQDKKLIEIKPKRLQKTPLVVAKITAAIEFCKNNDLEFEIIDFSINALEIKESLNNGLIKFARDYKERFLEYYNKSNF